KGHRWRSLQGSEPYRQLGHAVEHRQSRQSYEVVVASHARADNHKGHACRLGRLGIDRMVADVERFGGPEFEPGQRPLEALRVRLVLADVLAADDHVEQM